MTTNANSAIGILGGAQYEGVVEDDLERTVVTTRFGDVPMLKGTIGGRSVAYIRRFGWENQLASDIVNHTANALAFRSLGIRRVFTLNGFGGINKDINVGDIVVYSDYIKMVERTPTTIFHGETSWPRASMTPPFCPEIRASLVEAARGNYNKPVFDEAVNICVQGPHNETPAEIEAFRRWGADIICTTIYPEVVYYRELEICFAGLSWVCDMAAAEAEKDWVFPTLEELAPTVRAAVKSIPEQADCGCQHTWDGDEGKLPSWYMDMR